MAITVTAGTGVAGIPASTITVTLPASVASGDLLLILVDADASVTVTSPGYTQIHSNTQGADGFYILSKVAGSSESNPVLTFSSSLNACAIMLRVTGCDTVTGPAQFTTQVSSTTTASIDPPDTGAVKIAVVHSDPTAAGTVTWSGGATALTSITQSNFASVFPAYKLEDAAGAMTFTTTMTGTVAALIFSIGPAVVASTFVPQIISVT